MQGSFLKTQWNEIFLYLNTFFIQGFPLITNFTYFAMQINTKQPTQTFTNDKIHLDFIISANLEKYIGNVVEWLQSGFLPDNNVDFNISYDPLSIDVLVEAENPGLLYNVGSRKINKKVSSIPDIVSVNNYLSVVNGVDVERDNELRNRITTAAFATGKATIQSIKTSLEALPFVNSVNVIDLPLTHIENENVIYYSNQDKYTLSQKVAIDNLNLEIPSFVKGTDYFLNDNSQIVWIGNTPSNGNTFSVTYDCRKLGYVDAKIAGPFEFTSIQEEKIDHILNELTKAAGVHVTWSSPTAMNININAIVSVLNGYVFEVVQSKIYNELQKLLNSYAIGENVYISQIIRTISNVEGVNHVNLVTPSENVIVEDQELAREGNIIIENG